MGELLGHEAVVFADPVLGELDRLVHAPEGRCLVDLGAVGAKAAVPVGGPVPSGQGEDQPVVTGSSSTSASAAIPVLPLVGSRRMTRTALAAIKPSRSALSIIATPIRSLTEPPGLKYSTLATTSPATSAPRRGRETSGVLPTTADVSAPTRRVLAQQTHRPKVLEPCQLYGD